MRITDTHIYFWGSIYSNFYTRPDLFVEDKVYYNSSEQYFMAKKALHFNDTAIYTKIIAEDNPAIIKQYGREVKNFDFSQWAMVREEIMLSGVLAKFSQASDLTRQILATGDRCFVEVSPSDLIWGILHENN